MYCLFCALHVFSRFSTVTVSTKVNENCSRVVIINIKERTNQEGLHMHLFDQKYCQINIVSI